MKAFRAVLLALVLAGSLAALRAGEQSSVGPLPSARPGATVDGTERNPFAKKEEPKAKQATAARDMESEEGRIRSALESLEIVGRARDGDGWKVLMGDLILVKGTVLPPIISGQTYVLQVVGISEVSLEIEWTEQGSNSPPRRFLVPIRLRPTVRSGREDPRPAATPVVIKVPDHTAPRNVNAFAVQD